MMISRTRFIAFLMSVGGVMSLTGALAQQNSNDIRLGMSSEPSSIDPHFAAVAPNLAITAHLFDALVNVDPAGRYIPGLASSWSQIDKTTFEFKLRPGIKFHDGSVFTAEDVVFSLERPAKIVNSPGPFTSYTKMIASTQIFDPLTIRIKTTEPYSPLAADLSSVYIVSKKAASNATADEFNNGKAAIGTGPYKFIQLKRGESVSMVRNSDYWGEKPIFENITFRFITSDSARLSALLAGDVDVIENVPPSDINRIKSDSRFNFRQRATWRSIFFQLNFSAADKSPYFTDKSGIPLDKNPLKDIRVRQALSKSLNRDAIVRGILDGLGAPTSQVVGAGLIGFTTEIKAEAVDLDEARRLLSEAGYPNGFGLTLTAPNNRYVKDDEIAQTVAQLWGRIGIQVKVITMPVATYFPKMRNGEFGVAMLGWGTLGGDTGLRTLLATADSTKGWGTWNWGKYSNQKLDEAIQVAFSAPSAEKRHEAAQQAMTLAMKDYAVIPIHYQVGTWAMKSNIDYIGRVDEFTYAHQLKNK